jgi:RNA polymerase sigma factor (sigma-70 family)
MSKQWTPDQESFDRLLAWLSSDREQAGKRYEEIRQSLIKIFTWRGVAEAEELADETINRVTRKLNDLTEIYTGDPALYFYGVAKNVLIEYQRQPRHIPLEEQQSILVPEDEPDTSEQIYECMERCLQKLSPNNREIILRYYKERRQAKINYRKDIAKQMGVSLNNLRVRIYRIRATLENCINSCLKTSGTKELG